MTKRKVSQAVMDTALIMEEKSQVLYGDVMHIDGSKFLITSDPLQLTQQCLVTSESANQLGLGLQGHINTLRSRGFTPTIVYTDPASAFRQLIKAFPGVIIDVSGAGDHVSKVDAKIRRTKELYRSVKSGLPWPLPITMVKDLVAYLVARMNIKRTTGINCNTRPKILFTGTKINYKRELALAFGDYCEVYDGTNNTSASRSILCIALFPSNNSTGSWKFMNLQTKQRVHRSHWKLMATTELIINAMINFEEKSNPMPAEPELEPEVRVEAKEEELPVEEPTNLVDDEPPALIDAPDSDSDNDEPEQGVASRTRRQTGTVVNPPEHYTLASVKVYKGQERDPERIKKLKKSEKEEIELLLVDLQGLRHVYEQESVYKCHMFSVEFLATGKHEKFKSCLVFDGSEQEAELFPDRSSPTAALHSLIACLTVAAHNKVEKISKIDVKGAFIQTEMEGPPLYIQCDKNLTRLIVDVLPGIKKYVTARGMLYCQLLKVLYGCVQASKLWYKKLTKFLREQGYEHSPTDPCIMRQIVGNQVFLLVIYVDNILFIATEDEMSQLKDEFVKKFKWNMMDIGPAHSHLGMQIILQAGSIMIDMRHFIDKLLTTCGESDLEKPASPAGKDIFTIDPKASMIDEKLRHTFHTNVAKLF